jgi:hypothetical protein
MEVKGTERWKAKNFGRKHPEGNYHLQIRVESTKSFKKIRFTKGNGLEDR